MSKSITQVVLTLAVTLAIGSQAFGQADRKAEEAKLIAVIKSDAGIKEKADACRDLALVGTKDAVAPLAALLGDDKLGHMARYGLEPIPDPAVDDALRDALGKLKGRPQIGVIGSIGVRKDAKAIDALSKLLADADAEVAQASARALGKIGNADAAKAIEAALPKAPEGNQVAFCEGLFRCAEALQAAGQREQAMGLYDRLRALKPAAQQVRVAALRGAILIRGKDGVALLRQHLRSEDRVLLAAAVRASLELPGPEVTAALTGEIKELAADHQIMVLQAMGKRGDPAALPTVMTLANTGAKPVRVQAIQTLAALGDVKAMPTLLDLLADKDGELSQAAMESLASLPGKEVDDAIVAIVNSNDPVKRLVGLDLVARRRMTSSVPALMKAAADADPKVRTTAIRRLGDLATAAELPSILDLLMKAEGPDLAAAEQAVTDVCSKADKPETCVPTLVARMPQAKPAQQSAILRVLSTIGGAEAIKTVRGIIGGQNVDPQVRSTAFRALGTWKTTDAAPDLLEIAKTANNPTDKILALRSYLTMASRSDLSPNQRLDMCRQAMGLIQRVEEKRMLLAALSGIQNAESVTVVATYLDDADVKEEAATAVVTNAQRLLRLNIAKDAAAKLVDPLQKVSTSTNADLANRAKTLLQQAKTKAGTN
jgi:HEAT repeat protein